MPELVVLCACAPQPQQRLSQCFVDRQELLAPCRNGQKKVVLANRISELM
ncbi:hypothetical protein E2C01_081599 [Portunus trituberculatus]|uniref:Uncharacterized protein n=1 Tax=Portunus trituberculatus TaxID=210409 RepID=A0A5B7IWY4_PORTR|nr:hypothetical protein [Portunus trituberculatus]